MSETRKFEFDIDDAVRRYADMVYRLAVLNSPNVSDADDIFQEVFLKLHKYKDRIKDEQHLKAWLIRVTVNQCKSLVTSAWNRHTVSTQQVGELREEPAYETESYEFSEVYQAVKELPDKYREVIYLYYYEELQIKEIADILKRPEATVKTRLARGRKLLNEQLKEEFCDGRF